jgi:ribosomal protein S18 acetylase RimI-like enzyme
MTDGTPSLVRLTEVDAERAGAGLARAFATDPLFAYMLPDVETRRRLFPWWFATCVRYGCQCGDVWAVVNGPDRDLLGIAIWLRLPDGDFTPERLERAGFGAAPAVIGEAAWKRLATANGYMDETQAQVVPPPSLYLLQLGIEPDHQGRGLGGFLLRRFLAAAQDAGLAACLGTFEPNNVGFYRRHGLEVVADKVEPASQLRFWIFGRGLGAPVLD